jgi:hypothetical protein
MTREEIEKALDEHRLEVAMTHNKWWKVRRNGKTKLWKRKEYRHKFEIPVKAGMNVFTYITHANVDDETMWRISND